MTWENMTSRPDGACLNMVTARDINSLFTPLIHAFDSTFLYVYENSTLVC